MKKYYAKLIPTKKGFVTDMRELFKVFDDGDKWVEWVNYPQKNAYVCQISVITSCKAHKCKKLVAVMRKDKIYLVRRDMIDIFRIETGL